MNKYRLGPPLVAVALFIGSGTAFAQQQPSQASDRISAQIGRMLIQIESDADKIRDLQAALTAKQKEIDDLRAKVEKK